MCNARQLFQPKRLGLLHARFVHGCTRPFFPQAAFFYPKSCYRGSAFRVFFRYLRNHFFFANHSPFLPFPFPASFRFFPWVFSLSPPLFSVVSVSFRSRRALYVYFMDNDHHRVPGGSLYVRQSVVNSIVTPSRHVSGREPYSGNFLARTSQMTGRSRGARTCGAVCSWMVNSRRHREFHL